MALVLGNLVTRIGQPRVVAEIIAGVAARANSAWRRLVAVDSPRVDQADLSAIATLALVLFMFLAGIEFDSSALRGNVGRATILATLSIGVPPAGGFAVAALAQLTSAPRPIRSCRLPSS